MRLVQISDLHLGKFCWDPRQLFSKRWVGNFNYLLRRQFQFSEAPIRGLMELFEEIQPDFLAVVGDLSTTAQPQEFTEAWNLISRLPLKENQILCLPGNHDAYTRKDFEQRTFYSQVPSAQGWKNGLCSVKLDKHWQLIGLDCTRVNGWGEAKGEFSLELEASLRETLEKLPCGVHVILANHFPLHERISEGHRLIGRKRLTQVLRDFPQVRLYLNGHSHHQDVEDRRCEGLPIFLDSGTCGHLEYGRLHVLDLTNSSTDISVYQWLKPQWSNFKGHSFDLT